MPPSLPRGVSLVTSFEDEAEHQHDTVDLDRLGEDGRPLVDVVLVPSGLEGAPFWELPADSRSGEQEAGLLECLAEHVHKQHRVLGLDLAKVSN